MVAVIRSTANQQKEIKKLTFSFERQFTKEDGDSRQMISMIATCSVYKLCHVKTVATLKLETFQFSPS